MKILRLLSVVALPVMTMAASVRQGPSGTVGGFTWGLTALDTALAALLQQAATGPGIGPNQLGDIVYQYSSSAGFTAILFVKNSAASISADACNLAEVAFNNLGSSGERILVQTNDGLTKFAVYVTSFTAQGDSKKRDTMSDLASLGARSALETRSSVDLLASLEDLSTIEERSPADDSDLAKRSTGLFTAPSCSNLKAKRGPTPVEEAKRASTAIAQLTGNTGNVGCDTTDDVCGILTLEGDGESKCKKCSGGTHYYVRTYNEGGHCGGAFFSSDDCTGNPISGYEESVDGNCAALAYNSFYLECVGT